MPDPTSPYEAPPPPPQRPRPFQFSLATLMGVMTLVAVGLAVLTTLPEWVGLLGVAIFQVALIGFLVAGALFAHGDGRTFCIGALAAHLLGATGSIVWYVTSDPSFRGSPLAVRVVVQIASTLLLVLVAGWVCVRAQRYWERRDE